MSLKRSLSSGRSSLSGDAGAKVDRQELYDELKRLAARGYAIRKVKEGNETRYFARAPEAPSCCSNAAAARAGWLLIESVCPQVQSTSPRRGEVDRFAQQIG